MVFLKRSIVIFIMTFFVSVMILGQPIVGFIGNEQFGIFNGRHASLTVAAKRNDVFNYAVASRVGGVIFQATAIPMENAIGKILNISYDQLKEDGHRLVISYESFTISPTIYDWQLIPMVKLANSKYTACISLLGFPETDTEVTLDTENTMWAEFHPDLINTLIGFNLFFVDAMLVDANPDRMRKVTQYFKGIIPGYNDIPINENNSRIGAAYLNAILAEDESWDSYIYTDANTEIKFKFGINDIIFNGIPTYHFIKLDDDQEIVVLDQGLNIQIQNNLMQIRSINPIIYDLAEKTAQWSALFRYIKEANISSWTQFVMQIDRVKLQYSIETPRYWLRQ